LLAVKSKEPGTFVLGSFCDLVRISAPSSVRAVDKTPLFTHMDILVRILDPLVFVQSKHRTPSLAAQDFVRIQPPSSVRAVDKTPLFAALIQPFFIFIPFANEFATALNEKCPPQSGRHFVRVTSSGFKPETFRAVI
jgi:hypothetical protein